MTSGFLLGMEKNFFMLIKSRHAQYPLLVPWLTLSTIYIFGKAEYLMALFTARSWKQAWKTLTRQVLQSQVVLCPLLHKHLILNTCRSVRNWSWLRACLLKWLLILEVETLLVSTNLNFTRYK